MAELVVRPLARVGLTPNMVSVLGFGLNVGVAYVLATGNLRLGGVLLLLAGAADMLDGALARITQSQSTFGAFFDSVLDRYSEAAIVVGLTYTYTVHHNTTAVVLLLAFLVGSFMISYTRARAEGLGLECKVGLLPRPERIIILGLGLLLGILVPVLILLVALTAATALQRIYHVWRQTLQPSAGRSPAQQSNTSLPATTGMGEAREEA